eukprot:GHVR01178218.1.p1 GENE.GHVR01178218.1~~GHVR01178218.1.p1  ORF type:complete len:124 (-),score=78.84 GHVR01178218.1:58-429(-)
MFASVNTHTHTHTHPSPVCVCVTRVCVYAPPRSLLVFRGVYYTDMLHTVPARHEDLVPSDSIIPMGVVLPASRLVVRETRVSVTLRHVPTYNNIVEFSNTHTHTHTHIHTSVAKIVVRIKKLL